jgi:hypothetical protein
MLVGFRQVLSGSALGTISALAAASITVHTDGGDVTCAVAERSPKLGDYHVGDKVKIACADGVLTTIAKVVPPADIQTVLGTLTALTDTSLTVHTEKGDVTCTRNDHSPRVGDLRVGDRVKMACTRGVLTAIAKVELTMGATGVLTAFGDASVTVLTDGGARTCTRGPNSPSLAGFAVGDKVKIACTNGVLTSIAKVELVQTSYGTLTALSSTSLTVHTEGGDVTCTLNDHSPGLGDYHVGDRVKLACTNGVLTAVAKLDSVTTITTGVLTAFEPTWLTVLSDGGTRKCSRTVASPSLDGYQVGNHVRATCVNGVLTAIEHL